LLPVVAIIPLPSSKLYFTLPSFGKEGLDHSVSPTCIIYDSSLVPMQLLFAGKKMQHYSLGH
jgi:hypothetical protein